MSDTSTEIMFVGRSRVTVPPKARLLVFPYAGGGASAFAPWLTALPEALDVRLLELPGRGRQITRPPVRDWDTLVSATTKRIAAENPLPLYVYGHSFGALFAFEVCRNMARLKLPTPECLVVAAHRPPNTPPILPLLGRVAEEDLLAAVERFGALPEGVRQEPAFLKQMLPVLQADLRLCDDYEYSPGPPLDCPILALAGLGDERIRLAEMGEWQSQTRSRFELQRFPGGHMFQNENRAMLLDFLVDSLWADLA